jgi:hypothetical protein
MFCGSRETWRYGHEGPDLCTASQQRGLSREQLVMKPHAQVRASDSDRDRVAGLLGEHYAHGRITAEEFDERLERLYGSRTYGELRVLTSDLPSSTVMDERPAVVRDRRPAVTDNGTNRWAAWGLASGINWVIWLIVSLNGGDFVYPWPLWVMGPVGRDSCWSPRSARPPGGAAATDPPKGRPGRVTRESTPGRVAGASPARVSGRAALTEQS